MSVDHRKLPRPDVPSGEQLLAELMAFAATKGVSFGEAVRPLGHGDVLKRQLELAARPTSHTIARVRALIDGRPIPPVQKRNRSDGGGAAALAKARKASLASSVAKSLARRPATVIAKTRELTEAERLATPSGLIREIDARWPAWAEQVGAFAEVEGIHLGEAWLRVVKAGIQCLTEGDD